MPVSCSLGGPPSYSSPVVAFFSRGHPRSGNFYSTVPVDFGRLKSYENCLFERGSRSINLASFQCFKKKKNEHFSSPTTTSRARINDNFLTTARNYFWSTTKSKRDAMWLAPVSSSRGETENIRVLDTGIHSDKQAPSINQVPRVRPGTRCAVGHSIVKVNHSMVTHSVWWAIQ